MLLHLPLCWLLVMLSQLTTLRWEFDDECIFLTWWLAIGYWIDDTWYDGIGEAGTGNVNGKLINVMVPSIIRFKNLNKRESTRFWIQWWKFEKDKTRSVWHFLPYSLFENKVDQLRETEVRMLWTHMNEFEQSTKEPQSGLRWKKNNMETWNLIMPEVAKKVDIWIRKQKLGRREDCYVKVK